MKRDECLAAISEAFNGVKVEAVVGYWNVRIDSDPPRELLLMESFVAKHIKGNGMTRGELRDLIKTIPDSQWTKRSDGLLMFALN